MDDIDDDIIEDAMGMAISIVEDIAPEGYNITVIVESKVNGGPVFVRSHVDNIPSHLRDVAESIDRADAPVKGLS